MGRGLGVKDQKMNELLWRECWWFTLDEVFIKSCGGNAGGLLWMRFLLKVVEGMLVVYSG